MEKGLAIITGADGGMGQVITAALAKEGYPVIMANPFSITYILISLFL